MCYIMLQQIKKNLSRLILVLGTLSVVVLANSSSADAFRMNTNTVQNFAAAQTELDRVGGSAAARKKVNCKHDTGESGSQLTTEGCGILKFIAVATNALGAIAGVVIVIMIIVGGIQYASAGANPQAVSAAKGKIRNALLALAMFIFMYSFLQWLIPGGVFR